MAPEIVPEDVEGEVVVVGLPEELDGFFTADSTPILCPISSSFPSNQAGSTLMKSNRLSFLAVSEFITSLMWTAMIADPG